jgi:nucleoside 2-deoxyribosyltransferase
MKKIFLSHRFTGEDINDLRETLGKITSTLRTEGHEVYCSIEDTAWFQEQKHTNKEIMEHAFRKLDESEAIIAFIRSPERSEGMLMEIGYSLAKGKSFILAIKKDLKTMAIGEMANPLIEFETVEELCKKLKTVF